MKSATMQSEQWHTKTWGCMNMVHSTKFWIFAHMKHVSSENLFLALKALPRVMSKDKADFRVRELQLPKYDEKKNFNKA